MIKLPMPDLREDGAAEAFYNSGKVTFDSYKDGVGVAESIDRLLKAYGLQLGEYDTGSTDVCYTILPLDDDSTPEGTNRVGEVLNETLTANKRLRDEVGAYRRWISNEVQKIDSKLADLDFYAGGGTLERALLHAQKDMLEKLRKESQSFP